MPKTTDREMPKRKRCKRDLDRIHSKILKAKKKLDNVGKNGDKDRQRRQGQAKICTRLLPRSAFGIYRNGAKGKNIHKETSESTFDRARLKADALKLFNGDTPEVKYTDELSTHNETTEQLESNKDFVKNSLKLWTPNSILEQSAVLKRKQNKNQKLHLVKKKNEENFCKNLDSDKIKKQNVNNGSKYIDQKKSKQKLFQNDKEQSKAATTTQMQIFDDDFMEENGVNEDRIQQTYRDCKNISKALNHYKELCKMISDVNFGDFLQNYQSDPLTTTIKKLRCTYSNSLRQQYLRERNKLETVKSSALSVENQACTYSDVSQMSPAIEYEVPKCSENRTISPFLLEDIPEQDDKIHSMQSDNVEPYDSISCLSQTLETYDINDCIIRNRKNNDNQYSKQSADIYQSPRTVNSMNEKDSIQEHYINHSSKNKRHNKNNFYVDFSDHENLQCIDNRKHAEISTFSNDSILFAEKYLSRDTCEKSPNNFSNRVINKCNAKNVKRPVIHHRYNHVTATKDNHSAQKNDDLFYKMNYAEKLYKQFGININNKRDNERHAYVDSSHQQKNKQELETVKLPDLSMKYQACSDVSQVSSKSTSIFNMDSEIPKYRENHTIAFPLIKDTSQKENKFHWMQKNITPYNDITKESYEIQFPNASRNFPTPRIINSQFFHDGTKMFKPRIESMNMEDSQESLMNIKESQESLIEKFDINMHSNKLNGRNRLCRFDDSLQTFETLYNTNAYTTERTRGREQVLSKVKNQLFHSHNYHANPCNFNIKSTKLPSQQAKLHICENNDAKQELLEKSLHNRNKNILFNSFNAKAIPSSLSFSQNIQPDQRFRESTCKEIFNKDVECAKNQINLNHCNEQYIYLDSTRCQHNVSQEHHFHKGAVQTIMQPRILHEDRDNRMDNCINLSTDVSLLLVEPKKNSAYTYPKMIDDQHHSVQNITQPIKYVAVNNNSDIQRIPIYISDNNIIEDVPLEVITLVKPNAQTEELYFHKKYHLCKHSIAN